MTSYRNVDTSHPEPEAKPEWAVPHRSVAQSLGDSSGWLNLHLFPPPNPLVLCRPDSHSQQFDTLPIKKIIINSANNLNYKGSTCVTHHIRKTRYIFLNRLQMEIRLEQTQFPTPLVLLGYIL